MTDEVIANSGTEGFIIQGDCGADITGYGDQPTGGDHAYLNDFTLMMPVVLAMLPMVLLLRAPDRESAAPATVST